MNILIIGVNGFIGSWLADFFTQNNITFTGLGTRDNPSSNYIQADITDFKQLENTIAKHTFDIIIHNAAFIGTNGQKNIEVNCLGTYNCIEFAKTVNCKRFIYISSIPVVGAPQNFPVTEEHPTNSTTVYHLSKLFGEKLLSFSENGDLNPIILRLPSPIGKGMNPTTIFPTIVKRCINNEDIQLIGHGGRIQNYIHIKDICAAINSAMQTKRTGIFNIASDKSYSNTELAKICIETLNSRSSIRYHGTDAQENTRWDISIEKAAKYLNFQPKIDIIDAIKELACS